MKFLLGCDPELFVVNKDGNPRSAYGLIPGTKKEPFKVDKGAIQVDGMALEFNIDPAETEEEFVQNIKTVMRQLRQAVPTDYDFHIVPSVKFHHAIMKKAPDEAKELGCDPDWDAYALQENPRPDANTNLRTAAGHLHIGLEENADVKSEAHLVKYATLVKHLDLFLGLRSLEWDRDFTRRTLYGNPGAMRLKPYGVEYRVLSNAWLAKEELVRFVYRQTKACIEDLSKNGALTPDQYKTIGNVLRSGVGFGSYYMKYKLSTDKRAKEAIAAAQAIKI